MRVGVDIVAMATAYGVKCDVLEYSDIYPTIIYIYFVVNMHEECPILDEVKAVLRSKITQNKSAVKGLNKIA